MAKDCYLNGEDIPQIREMIEHAKRSEEVVIFRQGRTHLSAERWIEVLKQECGLIQDRRHFNADSEINLADWWEVVFLPENQTTYANAKSPQPLHTDNSWFGQAAELNFFIMDRQARSGGEQTIYPASRLVEDLGALNPGLLHDLSNVQVTIGKGEHDDFNNTTIIKFVDGQPKLAWNYYRVFRDSAEIDSMCEAFFQFLDQQVQGSSSVEKIRLDSGDCMSFNDLHLLHGRTAFEAELPRERVLMHSMWKLPTPGSA